jgi:hypothetical protein
MSGFNFSGSVYPSINADGDRFCFLTYSNPPQIWIGDILSDGAGSEPKINGVQFTPNYVLSDGSSTATIEAYISDINYPIDFVTIQSVQKGSIYFRALTADGGEDAFYPRLFDDGTYGDLTAEDNIYTNNTVRRDLPDTPEGEYGVRIAAVNTSHRQITMIDAETFFIRDKATKLGIQQELSSDYILQQNYPNPFNPSTTINYSIPSDEKRETRNVKLIVYDIQGREVTTLVNQKQKTGNYAINWNAGNHSSGIYFYELTAGNHKETKKMLLIR